VKATVDKFAKPIMAALRKRDTAMRRHAKMLNDQAETPPTSGVRKP
jgi:hypothetical protein